MGGLHLHDLRRGDGLAETLGGFLGGFLDLGTSDDQRSANKVVAEGLAVYY